jgi:hypothetical protein
VTEDEVREVVAGMTTDPDPEREYELRQAECVIDIPQSGERFDRDGMRDVQRNFPGGAPDMNLKRLAGQGGVWVAELVSDYGDRPGGGASMSASSSSSRTARSPARPATTLSPSRRRRNVPNGACPPRAEL